MAAASWLCLTGCAPAYRRLRVPVGEVSTVNDWNQHSLGQDIKITTVTGGSYKGTIVALGDSLEVDVWDGPNAGVWRFARSEIASAHVRPRPVGGERAMQVVFFAPIIALAFLWYSFRNYD